VPFSNEGKSLIKNLHQFKDYASRRIVTDFLKITGKN